MSIPKADTEIRNFINSSYAKAHINGNGKYGNDDRFVSQSQSFIAAPILQKSATSFTGLQYLNMVISITIIS